MKRETLLAFFESLHRSFYINYNGEHDANYTTLINNGADFGASINYEDIKFKFDGTEYNIYRHDKIDNDLRWYSTSFSVIHFLINLINISQLKNKIEPQKFLDFLDDIDVTLQGNLNKCHKMEANVYGDGEMIVELSKGIEHEVSLAVMIYSICFRLHFTAEGLFLMNEPFKLCDYAVEKIKLFKVMESV